MYHRVADVVNDPWSLSVSPKHFAEQIQILKNKFFPIRLANICNENYPYIPKSPWVAITFDDGYRDNYHVAKNILKEYNLPATFFLVSKYLDAKSHFWWDSLTEIFLTPGKLPSLSKLNLNLGIPIEHWEAAKIFTTEQYLENLSWQWENGDPTPRHQLFRTIYYILRNQTETKRNKYIERLIKHLDIHSNNLVKYDLLSTKEAKLLAQDELFDVGSHSVTHNDLTSLTISNQKREILKSKKALEKKIGCNIQSFSYAYGSYNDESVPLVKSAGFINACTALPGLVRNNANCFKLPRIGVRNCRGEQFFNIISEWLNK